MSKKITSILKSVRERYFIYLVGIAALLFTLMATGGC